MAEEIKGTPAKTFGEKPQSWTALESSGRAGFQVGRLGLHPGASWSLSWLILCAGGALVIGLPDSASALAIGFTLSSLFPALTLTGAFGFASRPSPGWVLPVGLGVGVVRGGLAFAGEATLGHAIALPYEVAFELWAAAVVWRSGLLRGRWMTRGLLVGSLCGVAGLEGGEFASRLTGNPATWAVPAWIAMGLATAFAEVWSMWFWIAQREVRVERAEGGERALEHELDDHVRHEQRMERELNERSLVERDLRNKEALLFSRYERAPDLIVSLDPDTGVVRTCNRKFSETLGYRRRELEGRQLVDFADVSTASALADGLERAARDGSVRDVAFRLQRRNGAFIDVLANAVLLHPEAGPPELHAILRNISRLPLAHLGETSDERLYHTLVECSPVAIFATDVEGHCVFVNQRFCDISGLTPEEARGHGWLERVHPDDRDRVAQEWYDGVEKREGFYSRHRICPPSGGEVEVLAQTTPLPSGEDGTPPRHVGTVTVIDVAD